MSLIKNEHLNDFFACMWCCISVPNSIHSLPSWLRPTFLDSAFPSLGYLGEIFHHAPRLRFPSCHERNPSGNAKQLQGHAATKLFITFYQIGHQQHIVVSSMFS